MSDVFHEERLKRIALINQQYAEALEKLEDWRRTEFAALYEEMRIKQAGWETFVEGESLAANPYNFNKEPDESNYWEAGWEMAYAENKTGRSN